MRIILYTGKGGVGKTSLSAATAVSSAAKGKRTIVMSTDAAHSLADAFDLSLKKGPNELAPCLFAEEISVHQELKGHWGNIQGYIIEFLTSQGYNGYIAEELSVFPGMEELFALLKLHDYEQSGAYDVAVVDCAPTGATLKMLGFTDIIEWYMERFFDLERRILTTIRPIAERVIGAPLPKDDVYKSVEKLYHRLLAIRDLLTDPEQTSIRLVCNPEKMVIKESQRAYTYLNLFGYPVDLVVNNRMLPPEAKGTYLDHWMGVQKKYQRQVKRSFEPIPVRTATQFPEEMIGMDKLSTLASVVFDGKDPSDIFYRDKPIKITEGDGEYVLSIKLPGANKDEIDLWVKDGEVIISVYDYQRNILLPSAMRDMELTRAKFEEDRFDIIFVRPQ